MASGSVGWFDLSVAMLMFFAVGRGVYLAMAGDATVVEVWRRRWLEVIGIVIVALILFAVGRIGM